MTRLSLIAGAIALAVAMAAGVGWKAADIIEARRSAAARSAAIDTSNAVASADTSRDPAATDARVAHLLSDSLRLAERLVVQTSQRADELDAALGTERQATYAMRVAMDSLAAIARATPSSDSVVFTLRRIPYTMRAVARLPLPPDSASLAVDVALDTLPIAARISCSKPNAVGARTASIDALTPPWARVTIGISEQTREVCNPSLPPPPQSRGRFAFDRVVVGAGFIRSHMSWTVGAFVGSGVSLHF